MSEVLSSQSPNHCNTYLLTSGMAITNCSGRAPGGLLYSVIIVVRVTMIAKSETKLSTTDLLALASMKNAAKCDK
jgi:hypothetical protein